LALAAALTVVAAVLPAGVSAANYFGTGVSATTCTYLSDNSVYQRNKPMAIWGTASNGAKLTAILKKDNAKVAEASATAKNGKWKMELEGQDGGYTAYTLTINVNGSKAFEFKNIVFGEVWLSSGQSNMQLSLGDTADGAEVLKNSDDEYLRIYYEPVLPAGTVYPTTPASDVPGAVWMTGKSGYSLKKVSAISFSFANKLRKELDVPVAVIDTAVGSAWIETWLSKELLAEDQELLEKVKSYGVYTENPTEWNQLGVLYNSKIAPLSGLNIGGVIWYQGEGNISRSDIYGDELDLLKKEWGKIFGYDDDSMPFVFAQLAPYGYSQSIGKMCDSMAEMQKNNSATTAMVPIYDQSLEYKGFTGRVPAVIHPSYKKEIAERMATSALSIIRGGEVATAPTVADVRFNGDTVTLTFDNVGEGLTTLKNSINVVGFSLAGEDGRWVAATGVITGKNTVSVRSTMMRSPKRVAYAYNNYNVDGTLCSSYGIPASPYSNYNLRTIGDISYLNCDGEIFVVSNFETSDTEVGHGEYKNIWKGTDNVKLIFDKENKADGVASLRVEYEKGENEVGTLTRPNSLHNVDMVPLRGMTALTASFKNGDDREKKIVLKITSFSNDVSYSSPLKLEANADFTTLVFDLTSLFDKDGNALENTSSICNNAMDIGFVIKDSQDGTVWLDSVFFGPDAYAKDSFSATASFTEDKANGQKDGGHSIGTVIAIVAAVLVVIILAVAFIIIGKKKPAAQTPEITAAVETEADADASADDK